MRRQLDPASWSTAFSLGLLGLLVCAELAAQAPACVGGTQQSFSATGSVQTYTVPADATAVYIVADGASGGNSTTGTGGPGAHIAAQVPFSGPSTLNVLVGVQGADAGASDAGAGGGGGSFVYTAGNALLLAAGGGGGACQNSGGKPGELFENGGDGEHFSGGHGGTSGGGGGGGGQLGHGNGGGGGGGFLGAGDVGLGSLPGQGGHRVSSPGDAAGGTGGAPDGGSGGFGGGGGGGASGPFGGGGGGGGYSGGGAGGFFSGGGGSFTAAGASFVDRAFGTAAGPGSVTLCVSQIVVPDLTISKSHVGSFAQGDAGRQYTITITNVGSQPTSAPVTATDMLPFGLVATGFGGTGWSACTATPVAGPAMLTCSRSDALAPGNSYPTLTLTVDVNGDAPALLTNSAQVAGGGETNTANDTADDPTTIGPAGALACTTDDGTLCLNGQRFKVTATFDAGGGNAGAAHAVTLTADTGYFWFFNSSNVEVVVKVLNGCGSGGHYWVFAAGLTNVETVLTVTDTRTRAMKSYTNPPNTTFAPIQDTSAFATCP
jgi:hypothetical protein